MNVRNYGIDLLRIISVLMITCMHIIKPGMGQYALVSGVLSIKIIYAICSVGVDCFLLISGYVYFNSKYKISNIIKLFLEAVLYNLSLTIIISLVNGTLSLSRIIQSFNILGNGNWWFLRSYLVLFLFIPLIVTAIKNLNNKTVVFFLLFSVFFLSVYNTLSKGDIFYIGEGFSSLWFIVVFSIGVFIKKRENELKINSISFFIVFVLCILLTVYSYYYLTNFNITHLDTYISETLFYQYSSPTIIFGSISLLIIFSRIQLKGILIKIISFITPSILPIYLIQCQNYVYGYYFPDFFSFLSSYNNKLYILIPTLGLLIVVVLTLIDKIRIILGKLIQINKFYNKIDQLFLNHTK